MRESECTPNEDHLPFVTHHLYPILFAKSRSLNPNHVLEEGITQRCEYQEAGMIGATLEVSCHIMQRAGKVFKEKKENAKVLSARNPNYVSGSERKLREVECTE